MSEWKKGRILSVPKVYDGRVGFWTRFNDEIRLCYSAKEHEKLDLVFLLPNDSIRIRGSAYRKDNTDCMQVKDIKTGNLTTSNYQ